MQRILNASILGISGRQSELIELALTHGFKGLDIEIDDLRKRVQSQGFEQARRFLESAKLTVSSFEVPCQNDPHDADSPHDRQELEERFRIGAAMGASRCYTTILPASDELPYHQNFEFHRKKLRELAELAAGHGMQLGVGFLAAACHRAERAFQFIYQADQLMMLIKTTGAPNIGIVLDTWNWYVGGGTLDFIQQLRTNEITGVRLADLPAEFDPATIDESQRLVPGDGGVVDTAAILNHLVDMEYSGPIAVHVGTSAFQGLSKGPARDAMVQHIAKALDAAFQAAGLSRSGKRLLSTTPANAS
ncbi:MAG: sugar phosphate isomerase/epimerase [Planctomycetes bacterium]|nr:sugar phosphate isomerase/epimerase [Planctomycetota bacterium]